MKLPIVVFLDKGKAFTESASEFKLVEDKHLVMECEWFVWKMYKDISLIVDSDGESFALKEIEIKPVHQNRLKEFFRRISGGKVELHLWLSPSSPITLADFKQFILNSFKKYPGYWDDVLPDSEKSQERIREANSFREIIALLQE